MTQVTALVGALTGVAGLVLGIVNQMRDRPRVVVRLQWDMAVTDNRRYDPNKRWGIVTVSNVGRRPIYIRVANLELPKGYAHTNSVLSEGIAGQKLAEGDPPAMYVLSQDGLGKYKKDWHRIRAVVFDTAGKAYRSKVDNSKRPSWANSANSSV